MAGRGMGGRPPHPTTFFEPPPPIKSNAPPMGSPLLKNEAPHPNLKTTPPALKSEAPFHEMIPRKSKINNNLISS